jgi:hypothetical protein
MARHFLFAQAPFTGPEASPSNVINPIGASRGGEYREMKRAEQTEQTLKMLVATPLYAR